MQAHPGTVELHPKAVDSHPGVVSAHSFAHEVLLAYYVQCNISGRKLYFICILQSTNGSLILIMYR